MCLTLPQNPATKAPEKPIKVLKAYKYNITADTLTLHAIFCGKSFNPNNALTIVSNRTGGRYLTPEEIRSGDIHQGLHGFTTRKNLHEFLAETASLTGLGAVIVEFIGQPEEFIARGNKGDVAFHKLKFNKIVSYKSPYTSDFIPAGIYFDKYLNGGYEVAV